MFNLLFTLLRYLLLYIVVLSASSFISSFFSIPFSNYAEILFSSLLLIFIYFIAERFDKIKVEIGKLTNIILVTSISITIAILFTSYLLIYFINDCSSFHLNTSSEYKNTFLTATYAAILGGVIEELFFRGLITKIVNERYNYIVSILLTSLLFTIIHTGTDVFSLFSLYIFSLSIICGVLLEHFKTMYAPIIFHTFWNFLVVITNKTDDLVPIFSFCFLDLKNESEFYIICSLSLLTGSFIISKIK
jgi:uncharacterized protein